MADLIRPEPLLKPRADRTDRRRSPDDAAAALLAGRRLLVTDRYSTGAEILSRLSARLTPPRGASYAERQAASERLLAAGANLIAPIADHRVALSGARPIGFLAELYPKLSRFWLPFPAVQELHGAWQRYEAGIHFAVLGHRLHPFFGTYLPTRVDHLALFGTWLSRYDGPKARCIDVGCGSGILSLMLARSGAGKVLATDSNPNAVESLRRELARLQPTPAITPRCTDLLGDGQEPADLIVFNPPWIQGSPTSPLDHALYFGPDLLPRFFAQAADRLAPGGRIVLVFSNVLRLLQPDAPHPIEAELARGRLTLDEKLQRKAKRAGGRRTREKVEVWVLAKTST